MDSTPRAGREDGEGVGGVPAHVMNESPAGGVEEGVDDIGEEYNWDVARTETD